MKNKKLAGIFIGLALLLIGSSARAQEDVKETSSLTREEKTSSVLLKTRHIYESDVAANDEGIAVTESAFEFEQGLKFHEMPINLQVNYKHIDIQEDMPLELPSHLEGIEFGLGAKFYAPFMDHEHYFMGIDIFPSMYTDDGTWKTGAFRLPFRTYLIYKESDDFIVIVGIKVRPDYDTTVLPIIGFIYKANDRLTFNITDEPEITYKLNDKTTALVEFDLTNDEYEVTRDGQEGVVLKYSSFSAGAGLRYNLTEDIQASASVGGVFGRRIEYRDDVGKAVPDAGLYTGLKLTGNF